MTQGARAFWTVGLPLFVLTVSGFYGLSHLVQGKFDVQAQRQKVVDLKVDPEKQKSFSLEEELQVGLDARTWPNGRQASVSAH
ncbi:TPA: hypothetical protein ACH3X1_009990 [Trebouxia sp. C0004]